MESITFINKRGQSVTLGNSGSFVLTKIEGTGAVSANIQSQKSPYQDGKSYIDNTLEPRLINIELVILADSIEKMTRNRAKLIQVFNPKLGEGVLIYRLGNIEKSIKAIAELPPTFPHDSDFQDSMQSCLIQLVCHNPFWVDTAESKQEVAIWRPAFEFPFAIPHDTGMEFGYREPSLFTEIHNPGDVSCGMKIVFKALATVVNPSLFNVNTREYFKINKTMEAGEIITVTTDFGNKRVEQYLNGVTTSAFHYVRDPDVTFLQLDVGDNLFRYDAEDGLDNLELDIYYSPLYLGV